jgi:glutathione S-transferase
VAFRIQTYEPPLNAGARRYAAQLLALPAMKAWYTAALQETWRDEEHEIEARAVGAWSQDLRAS